MHSYNEDIHIHLLSAVITPSPVGRVPMRAFDEKSKCSVDLQGCQINVSIHASTLERGYQKNMKTTNT